MAAGGAAGAANGMAGAGRRARGGRRREGAALRGRFGAREGPQRESQNVLSWKGPTRIIDSNSCPCTGAIVRFGEVCLLSSSFEPTVIVNGVTDKISAHVYPKDCFLGADFRFVTTSGAAAEMTAVEKIEEQLASLRIAKRSALSEEPAYVLDVDVSNPAQSESSRLVAVSCSNKSIRVYNRETLNFLREYSSQSGVLNGVRFAHACDSVLFSACSDGTVRCWDIRLATQQATQVFSGYPANVFISFDVSCNDLIICAGTEKVEKDAFLVFWDARGITNCASATREPLGVYSESHNDDITKICFHPVKPNSVASGSTDGLVNVFDINKDNEDDALISTCNSDSSVSFIGWSGKDYKEVYCVTHDEGFCWWDIAQLDTEESITLLHVLDVRDAVCIENDSLNYLVGGLYHEKADKLFLLGGTSTGNIHLLGCGTDGLSLVGSLCGGHSATVRSFCWNPADESLVTGGEDAQLLLWKPGAVERSLTKKTSLKIASSVQKRVRVHNSSLKSRKK